ncbi:MAG: HAMP domain-containing sensor histidine kinase [Pseudomonadota bacterium]
MPEPKRTITVGTSSLGNLSEADEFLYIVTHDLKAFTRAMRIIPDWIIDDLSDHKVVLPEDVNANFTMLRDYARRMDGMLDSLTELSRVGRIADAPSQMALHDLVDPIVEALPRAPTMQVDLDLNARLVFGPYNDFKRLFAALIENAQQHHDRDQGQILVKAKQRGTRVYVEVEDDGPGIPPEFWEKMFKPLHTMRPKGETQTSGVGLAVARKVVLSQGGSIELAPPAVLRGCRVIFDLPASDTRH